MEENACRVFGNLAQGIVLAFGLKLQGQRPHVSGLYLINAPAAERADNVLDDARFLAVIGALLPAKKYRARQRLLVSVTSRNKPLPSDRRTSLALPETLSILGFAASIPLMIKAISPSPVFNAPFRLR